MNCAGSSGKVNIGCSFIINLEFLFECGRVVLSDKLDNFNILLFIVSSLGDTKLSILG